MRSCLIGEDWCEMGSKSINDVSVRKRAESAIVVLLTVKNTNIK